MRKDQQSNGDTALGKRSAPNRNGCGIGENREGSICSCRGVHLLTQHRSPRKGERAGKGTPWSPCSTGGQSPPGHPGPSEDTKMSHFSLRALPWGRIKILFHFKAPSRAGAGLGCGTRGPIPCGSAHGSGSTGSFNEVSTQSCCPKKKTLSRGHKRHHLSVTFWDNPG